MFIAVWGNPENEVSTMVFRKEESLKDSAFNDPYFPTEEAVIHLLCDTTFEVVDTFKLKLTQI